MRQYIVYSKKSFLIRDEDKKLSSELKTLNARFLKKANGWLVDMDQEDELKKLNYSLFDEQPVADTKKKKNLNTAEKAENNNENSLAEKKKNPDESKIEDYIDEHKISQRETFLVKKLEEETMQREEKLRSELESIKQYGLNVDQQQKALIQKFQEETMQREEKLRSELESIKQYGLNVDQQQKALIQKFEDETKKREEEFARRLENERQAILKEMENETKLRDEELMKKISESKNEVLRQFLIESNKREEALIARFNRETQLREEEIVKRMTEVSAARNRDTETVVKKDPESALFPVTFDFKTEEDKIQPGRKLGEQNLTRKEKQLRSDKKPLKDFINENCDETQKLKSHNDIFSYYRLFSEKDDHNVLQQMKNLKKRLKEQKISTQPPPLY